ncbi:MAG: hypothetical protein QGI45_15640, partial [Myxococcota bacterium]|nr:hypothetical protein [Myxococcota bacterium]
MRIKPGTNNPSSELHTASSNAQTPATPNAPVDTLLEPLAPEKTNQNNTLEVQNPLQEPTSTSQTGLQKTDEILRRGWETHLLKSWSAMVEGGLNEIPDARHLAKQNPHINLSFLPPLGTARLDYMTTQKRLGKETLWASNQGSLQLKETLGRDVKLENGESIFSGWSLSNPMRYNLELPLHHDLEENPNADVARQSLEAFVLEDLNTQTILNLPPGARLELEGEGFYLGQRKRFRDGAPGDIGEHKIYLEVTRLNDDKISVKLSHKRNRPRLIKALENASDSLSASAKIGDDASIRANLELGFEWYETFEIDLDHPNAQNNIDTLLALDARSADQASQIDESGLIRTSELKSANNNLNINFTPLSITEAIS